MTTANITALCWDNVAPGSDLHAAFYVPQGARPVRVSPHSHADFCELFLVTHGAGAHQTDGARTALQPGDLHFLHAGTTAHSMTAPAGSLLSWINIAFPVRAWQAFIAFVPVPALVRHVRLSSSDYAVVLKTFDETLRAFALSGGTGDRLLLARFLSTVLPYLRGSLATPGTGSELPTSTPAWLRAATAAFTGDASGAALRGGAPWLRKCAGVSATHLARALQSATGQTPTQWVNERRLRHAALLLSITARLPADIAADCGFGELGYFYRLFRAHFGKTPGAYRQSGHGAVLP